MEKGQHFNHVLETRKNIFAYRSNSHDQLVRVSGRVLIIGRVQIYTEAIFDEFLHWSQVNFNCQLQMSQNKY